MTKDRDLNARDILSRVSKDRSFTSIDAIHLLTGKLIGMNNATKRCTGIRDFLNYGIVDSSTDNPADLANSPYDGLVLECESKDVRENGKVVKGKSINLIMDFNKIHNKSDTDIMISAGFDPLLWKVKLVKYKSWNVYSKKDNIQDLYSVSIEVLPTEQRIPICDIEVIVKRIADKHSEIFNDARKSVAHTDSTLKRALFEIPIVDLHLGKKAWKGETGQDVNLKTTKRIYKAVIKEIVRRAKLNCAYNVDRILFPIGSDFFQVDNDKGETNRGTRIDVDGRFAEIYEAGLEITVWALEFLQMSFPSTEIDVCFIKGNHDKNMSYTLVRNLESFYRINGLIAFDSRPTSRKYYEYGNSMICFTHGEEAKARVGEIMQHEASEMWGRTKFREMHTAHLHSESVVEHIGFKIRRIPSTSPLDVWEEEKGYVGSIRMGQGFLWTGDGGNEATINVPIINI